MTRSRRSTRRSSISSGFPLPYAAGFLAARCFLDYRRAGGVRRSPLPDFYIGAHGAIAGYALLTRDRGRYGTYFPRLEILSP